ncbi:transglycosylase SLT domain-containing protein [Streptococcus ferus]|uniref:transglycosylase SLT domain-containing protein n=1 Tax=Streptococcus ferus TaxID=1345 RepID=UPI0035A1A236
MYSRSKRAKLHKLAKSQLILIPLVLGLAAFLILHFGDNNAYVTKTASKVDADQVSETTTSLVTSTVTSQTTSPETTSEAASQEVTEAVTGDTSDAATAANASTAATQTGQPASNTYNGTLANGNTAGAEGSAAAAQMAAATGVPQSTWEYIIARESNGQANASNSSCASGLFQTMPGWGSTATVQDQINSAINAYNSQGLSAWGM